MAHQVFISYSSKDKEVADLVCAELERNKIECWIAPRNITPGKEWGEAIINAINESKIMVLIFSSSSNNSQQVLREVERAVNKNVIIIPFRIEDIVPTKSMEYFLYSTHWFDANVSNMQKSTERLVGIVRRLINEPEDQENGRNIYSNINGGIKNKPKNKNTLQLLVGGILIILLTVLITGLYLGKIHNSTDKYSLSKRTNANVKVKVKNNNDSKNDNNTRILKTADKNRATSVSNKSIKKTDKQTATTRDTKLKSTNKRKTKKDNTTNGEDLTATTQKNKLNMKGTKKNKEHVKQHKKGNLAHVTSAAKNPVVNIKNIENKKIKNQSSISKTDTKMAKLKIGDYIRFGTYNNTAIEWRIINIDKNGNPLLFSTRILTLKAFDASESGKYNTTGTSTEYDASKQDPKQTSDILHTNIFKTNYKGSVMNLRKMKGSNYWINSNIREWLNSSDKKVDYKTQPPTSKAISGGENNYDDEPGFLHFFSEKERKLIKPVNHKVLIPSSEKNQKDGGNEIFEFKRSKLSEVLSNYDHAYYKNIKDKVFLLSIEEAINFIVDRGWDLKAELTPEAINRDKSGWYNDIRSQTGGSYMWWLNTPMATLPSDVSIVGTKGDIIYNDYAASESIGVRPALSLDYAKMEIEGDGTQNNPYIIK